jgi:predicted permease
METLVQDVRYALRYFIHRPGFAAVAVLSFALAIGASTAIYGVVDGFVFNPFPYPGPDRLVSVGVTFPKLSSETTYIEALSPPEYLEIRSGRSFAQVAAFDLGNRNISGGDVPERVFTALLLDDLFPVLGMKPALGRGFTREELGPNGPAAVILSHRLWQSRFGGDPGILNRAIRIGGTSASVVGVMPPGLVLIGTDLWVPWGGDPVSFPRNRRQFNVIARLAEGVPLREANAELEALARRTDLAERGRFAEYEGWRLTATPWAAALFQDVRPAAFLLVGAVLLVLLIACANLANLFLARSTTRHRELAVRLALGAVRWRLARHLLTESLLLACAGAAAGMLIAWLAFNGADALIPQEFQMLGLKATFSTRVLAWSVGAALASGLLVALLPVLQATRTAPHDALKADSRAGGGRGGRLRQALVVSEIALSVVLLLGAGLFMRSLLNIQRVDPGFEPDDVLTMRLTLPREKYAGEQANVFFDALLERIEAVPGVRAAAAASQFPPMGVFDVRFALERGMPPTDTLPTALITFATPRYFETLGVPLQAGRGFEATDRLGTPLVAIVNRTFASRYFPGADPIGQRITIDPDARHTATIVGIVADVRNAGATQPVRPEIYVPVRQQIVWNQLFVLVRSEAAPAAVLSAVRQAVLALDPEQPIYAIQTLRDAQALSSFQQRISGTLLGIFAAVALVLAAVGIYGVMSYAVSARTQELGVRLALGARPGSITWLVLRQVLVLSGIGLSLGIGLLIGIGRALEQMLFGIRALDPATIAGVTTVLALVALAAAWGPASRASRVDPIEALRYE